MKEENAIEVSNISKRFRVYMDRGRTLKELTLFSRRRKYETRTVLDGISFEVKRGEAVGLVGQNGCGKSTTLKLLTRIMYPDAGKIEMRGRVSSLIELGAGFHPDMSGRQNIYTNAAIFGLTRKEIDARLDDIIAFSELEEFIDNPVRTYSSGMYMRLAFAVAINVNADILLIDEILAVGDANYQAKCFNKLREIKAGGTTIVIVSHSLGQIEQICERSIWIESGKIRAEGPPRQIHPMYLDFMGGKRQEILEKEAEREEEKRKAAEAARAAAEAAEAARAAKAGPLPEANAGNQANDQQGGQNGSQGRGQSEFTFGDQNAQQAAVPSDPAGQKTAEGEGASGQTVAGGSAAGEENAPQPGVPQGQTEERWGSGKARITGIRLLDADGKKRHAFRTGCDMAIHIDYEVSEPVYDAVFGIGVFRVDGAYVYGTNTRIDRMELFNLEKSGSFEIRIQNLCLIPADYTLDIAIEEGAGIAVDYYTRAAKIQVFSEIQDVGLARIGHQWVMEAEGETALPG